MKYFLIVMALVVFNTAIYAQPHVGSKVPDISLPDASGNEVKLSSLHGKVVLIDFWASWCGPCRRSNRDMLTPIYKQYKEKGLEVYGVSIDADKRAWANAVNQDKIGWMQVIDTKAATGNELTQTWNLQYIPSSFLIDKEGKLVAIAPEKNELEKLLKQLL